MNHAGGKHKRKEPGAFRKHRSIHGGKALMKTYSQQIILNSKGKTKYFYSVFFFEEE